MKTQLTSALLVGAVLMAGGVSRPAAAQTTMTIDFDTLAHPATGVGPATRVYQEYGPGTFTLIRIVDPNSLSSYGDHFHEVAGNGSVGHTNSTAAYFSSGDGTPFFFCDGDYTGTNNNTYQPDPTTQKVFSLLSFNVISLSAPNVSYTLTSSGGSTLLLDHAGLYNLANTPGLANFQNILSYRQDYTGSVAGSMVLDDITVSVAPEPGQLSAFLCGSALLGAIVWKAKRKPVLRNVL